MAAVLGTNVASLWASKNLQSAQSNMANSVERLSSGLRINRARDDAAGLGLANALTQQINSSDQGIRNLNDGISIVQTAEGAAIYSTTLNISLPQVTLITTKGSITVELDPTLAPISTNNFLSYVNKGFYRSTLFHRVIPNFVIQGGGYTAGMLKKTEQSAPIELESNKGLSNVRGSLAMARTYVPNSATSEFYINLVDNLSLDYKNAANPGYAVFGKVVQGMDVADAMATEPTGVVGGFSDVPVSDITLSLALQTK